MTDELKVCEYCSGTGKIEIANNGFIYKCPVCSDRPKIVTECLETFKSELDKNLKNTRSSSTFINKPD